MLKLLITVITALGHSEEWAETNLEKVIWMLKCVPVEGDKETGRYPLRLVDGGVDEDMLKDTLERAFDLHKKAQQYGQKLRKVGLVNTEESWTTEDDEACTLLFCFLVRENSRRDKEMQGALWSFAKSKKSQSEMSKTALDETCDDDEEMQSQMRKKFDLLSKSLSTKKALLREAASTSWLEIHEIPWVSSDGSAEDKAIRQFRFLFMAYRPSCWWFELFEMMRKLMMVGADASLVPLT